MFYEKLIDLGILTKEKTGEHALLPHSIAHIYKAYALFTGTPFKINNQKYYLYHHEDAYLTPYGFDWLLGVFSTYSLDYLRSAFTFLFSKATEDDISNPDYAWYRNFRGLSGKVQPAGSKQRAVLVFVRKRYKREQEFESLYDARQYIKTLSKLQSLEGYTLYRIRKNTKKGKVTYYREKVALIPPPRKDNLSIYATTRSISSN